MSTRDDENQNENEGRELAPVHYLPSTQHTDADVAESEVIEGEIVTAEQYRELQKQKALERYRAYRRDAVVVGRAVKTVTTHQRTKTVARHVLAHPAAGVKVVAKRWRDTHGSSRYERQMMAAELEGDQERLREWEARDVAEKQRRHQRTMDWITAPGQWIKAGVVGLLGLAGFLLAVGFILFADSGNLADVIAPISGVISAIAFVVWFVAAYGVFLVCGASVLGLYYLYKQGRDHGDTPKWLAAQPTGSETTDAGLDESMVMNALRNLGHPALNRKIKEGWGTSVQPTWVQPPMPVGHGWEFALRLPGGVPAASINGRKTVLAHNLGRRPEEVWVETDESDPMAMKCLVLNPGSLREPVPDYPLAESGQADFWTGFPVGIDARWNQVDSPVFERNFVWAGMMGSGKSTQIMNLLAGAALDPVVDIDVFCFADNNDYEWIRPIASTVSMGDTEDNVAACLAHISGLRESLAERGAALREHGISSVTRAAAEQDERLRPRVVIIDECQSFFRQDKPEDRREVVNMVIRFFSAARKYGIVLGFATPTPSDQSLPRDVVAVTSNKSCFAIGDKARNNVVLGEKAYESGLSALELKPAVKKGGKIVALNDVGTSVAVGFADQPGLLRSYNLTDEQKKAIVARGLELRGGTVRRTHLPAPVERDLLADVAAVLGPDEDKVPATDVCARLRELAPDHRPYGALKAEGLRDQLAEFGVKVTKVSVLMVFTERVREALAAREGGND
ncbi:DNA segregation ATPase FtsK/SpoIIIE, S-DNA-T family [Prauserella aidingensis]|uniref:hypothetical protein n=1 Tax=Prauserella aidingensis TaxID=387890 RepID=UPI0020A561E3|nr:hypothetical protein [Prauserella aidingensis]MCP2255230.1 DNA segregation ATPase FtsK/SpoIIIE, S-DNA-T family [Prauserella aidingensis]